MIEFATPATPATLFYIDRNTRARMVLTRSGVVSVAAVADLVWGQLARAGGEGRA